MALVTHWVDLKGQTGDVPLWILFKDTYTRLTSQDRGEESVSRRRNVLLPGADTNRKSKCKRLVRVVLFYFYVTLGLYFFWTLEFELQVDRVINSIHKYTLGNPLGVTRSPST